MCQPWKICRILHASRPMCILSAIYHCFFSEFGRPGVIHENQLEFFSIFGVFYRLYDTIFSKRSRGISSRNFLESFIHSGFFIGYLQTFNSERGPGCHPGIF